MTAANATLAARSRRVLASEAIAASDQTGRHVLLVLQSVQLLLGLRLFR
jgi:hypothetical protein